MKYNWFFAETVWFLSLVEVLGWKSNEWVANPIGPGQTSALQMKTRICIVVQRLFVTQDLLYIFFYSIYCFNNTMVKSSGSIMSLKLKLKLFIFTLII